MFSPQPRTTTRGGFTLVELMVVIMLISILTTFTLVALAGVTEKAKEDRTKAQIAKIHELIMNKWETYQYRTVPPTNYANGLAVRISRKGVKAALKDVAESQRERYQQQFSTILATDRLLATRELMRMEMPCQFEEVSVTSPSRLRDLVTGEKYFPSAYRAYVTRAVQSGGWTRDNASAECLYMIISQMREADRSALEFFKENEIGDVDGDGMKEILDAWGKPIVWLRWAPSFISPLQRPLVQKDDEGNLVEDPGQEDVLDPARVGSAYKLANFTGDYLGLPRTLYPLIFSAGPDGNYGIVLDTIEDTGHINTWMDLNHDPYDRNQQVKMYRLGAEFDELAATRQITSRTISSRRGNMKSRPQGTRAGFTLTELLVVIAIIVVVTAVLAPVLTPILQGREVREAARQVNAFLQNARAKARELRRPVGVVIRRSANDPNVAYQLSLAEELPPFTGSNTAARATIDVRQNSAAAGGTRDWGTCTLSNVFSGLEFVQPNDLIRFNFRGPKFRIRDIRQGSPDDATGIRPARVRFYLDNRTLRLSDNNSLPFEIFMRPKLSASAPLELPTGSALIMGLSGMGNSGSSMVSLISTPQDDSSASAKSLSKAIAEMPVTIMFDPSGKVDRVFRVNPGSSRVDWWTSTSLVQSPAYQAMSNYPPIEKARPTVHADGLQAAGLSTIYLFVGKDGINNPLLNLMDGTNLWITIDPLSGLTSTAANDASSVTATMEPTYLSPDLTLDSNQQERNALLQQLFVSLPLARQLASLGQNIGGQ